MQTDFGADDSAYGVAIQANGKIVAAGVAAAGAKSRDFALARYNPAGSLDPAFDGDGRAVTNFGADDSAVDVAIQADGKIVAAGSKEKRSRTPSGDFALARYLPDGALATAP